MRSRRRSTDCRPRCAPPPTRCASKKPPPCGTEFGTSRKCWWSPVPEAHPSRTEWAERRIPGVLIAVSVVLRLGAFLNPVPLGPEEARYLVAAHHLGLGMTYSDWRGPETHIHPLHPWLVSILGSDPDSLESRGSVVALVCSILLLLPLGALTLRLGGRLAAGAFLLLAGLHPWLVRASSPTQPESLYDLMTACGVTLLLWKCGGAVSAVRW